MLYQDYNLIMRMSCWGVMKPKQALNGLFISSVSSYEDAFNVFSSALAVIMKVFGEFSVDCLSGLTILGFKENLNKQEFNLALDKAKAKISCVNDDFVFNLQNKVQKVFNPEKRKRLAAYYTKPIGLEIMSRIMEHYLEFLSTPLVLTDPFLGSGLTLTSALKVMDTDDVSLVWGVEPNPLAALVAYSALLYHLEGDTDRIRVFVGDAFRLVSSKATLESFTSRDLTKWKADIVLTNPPFTRWEILDANYRRFLRGLIKNLGYGRYVIRGQLNLQLISLFLIDSILSDGGLLISVLPASTFYITSGEGVKRLLREKYEVLGLLECITDASFSTDSGFKELILACIKSRSEKPEKTAFISLSDVNSIASAVDIILRKRKAAKNLITNYVDLQTIPRIWDMNWLVLFGKNQLREFLLKLLVNAEKKGTVGHWSYTYGVKSLVRGVEMYGPDFFLIPNKYWNIMKKEASNIIIRDISGKNELYIHQDFLKPTLRRPGLYKNRILIEPEHYFLAIPPVNWKKLPKDLQEYIKWGVKSGTARPAVRAFGEFWYSHIYKQIQTKKPYGRTFLPDKVELQFKNRGVYAHYTEKPTIATKNFHIITLKDSKVHKVLTAWFNSTPFLALFVLTGRRISETWTRFLEDDYLKLPVLNAKSLNSEDLESICESLDKILDKDLPSLPNQLGEDYRMELDMAVIRAMGVEKPKNAVETIHELLGDFFDNNFR